MSSTSEAEKKSAPEAANCGAADTTETPKCGPILPETTQTLQNVLPHGFSRRIRDRNHLKFIANQLCLQCARWPSDAHHLTFAQPRAMGMKVSDEFVVPLCRLHHREVHHARNELAWWKDLKIDPIEVANKLWQESHPRLQKANSADPEDQTRIVEETQALQPRDDPQEQHGGEKQSQVDT